MTRFLLVRSRKRRSGALTEIDAAKELEEFRSIGDGRRRRSRTFRFRLDLLDRPERARSTITASPRASNRRLEPGDLYLIDSGAQYRDGTTDITRTVADRRRVERLDIIATASPAC